MFQSKFVSSNDTLRTMGDAFFQAGCRWLEDGSFPPTLNETNIALIIKTNSPESMKD